MAVPGWSRLHKLVREWSGITAVITTLPGEIIGRGQITQPARDFGQIGAARPWNATPDNPNPIFFTPACFWTNYELTPILNMLIDHA